MMVDPDDVSPYITPSQAVCLQLMVGEAQLADGGSHFIYVAINDLEAYHIKYQFVRQVRSEPGITVVRNQHQMIGLHPSNTVFFFVGLEYFSQRFAFVGTRIDRVFVDLPPDLTQQQLELFHAKIQILIAHGADIIYG